MNQNPMLACDANEAKLKFPYLVMPKLDGVRGVWLTQAITGRSLKAFKNKEVEKAFSNKLLKGIDGELIVPEYTSTDACRTTTGIVNRLDDPKAHTLLWFAFDYITDATVDLPYEQRLKALVELVGSLGMSQIQVVPYTTVNSLKEILALEQKYLAEGYEGVILRDPKGLLKSGRATTKENSFLRIKRFVQEDAVVVNIVEAEENTNEKAINELGKSYRTSHQAGKSGKNVVGALECITCKTGKPITVGPGAMTHAQRAEYFQNPELLVGKTISYKSFPKGVKDKPRFPTFVSIRVEEDLVDG